MMGIFADLTELEDAVELLEFRHLMAILQVVSLLLGIVMIIGRDTKEVDENMFIAGLKKNYEHELAVDIDYVKPGVSNPRYNTFQAWKWRCYLQHALLMAHPAMIIGWSYSMRMFSLQMMGLFCLVLD